MVELHLHLDGSLRPETVCDLAKEKHLPETDALPGETYLATVRKRMCVSGDCPSLTDYLECFRLPLAVLQDAPAITRAVCELGEDLRRDHVTTAEIRFAPYSCCAEGLTPQEAIDAAILGAERAMELYPALRLSLIICCMRGQEEAPFIGEVDAALTGEQANYRLLDLTRDRLGRIVKGADLAGAEALFPTARYANLFAYAHRLGIPYTIHAGEGAGADSVRAALSFPGIRRIGHGVRAIEDPLLVEELVRRKITLECCVVSNFHTRCFARPEDHPIRRLFDAGVRVTLNTDNRTISSTSMSREIETVQRMFGFSDRDIRTMGSYAEEALFR